jgi:membrane-bound inhibitor of C-type lysozyme
MPLRFPVRPRLALALAAAGLAAACAAPEKAPDAPSQDTIACQLEGQRLVIRFLPDEVRVLTPDGERVTLQKVPASTGVRYTNGLVEVRGGGGSPTMPDGLVFIREGTAWRLENCAPLMVPTPAK